MANFSLHSFPQIQNKFAFVKVLLDFDCSSKYALCANIENADQSHNISDEANFDNTMAWMIRMRMALFCKHNSFMEEISWVLLVMWAPCESTKPFGRNLCIPLWGAGLIYHLFLICSGMAVCLCSDQCYKLEFNMHKGLHKLTPIVESVWRNALSSA